MMNLCDYFNEVSCFAFFSRSFMYWNLGLLLCYYVIGSIECL